MNIGLPITSGNGGCTTVAWTITNIFDVFDGVGVYLFRDSTLFEDIVPEDISC